jgi:hypothetical protein
VVVSVVEEDAAAHVAIVRADTVVARMAIRRVLDQVRSGRVSLARVIVPPVRSVVVSGVAVALHLRLRMTLVMLAGATTRDCCVRKRTHSK